MNEPQKIDEVIDPQLLESGVWKSVDVLKVPLWLDGLNVDFRKGQVEKSRGWSVVAEASENINAVAQAFVAGEKRAYLGTTSTLSYWVEGQEIYPIRTSGLTSGGDWSMIAWGKFLLASNGLDRVQFWQNSGQASDLTDGPLSADIILPLNIFILALNADGEDGRVEWCQGGNPLVWTPTLTNDAGGFNIRNVSSKLTCGVLVGENVFVFTETQAYLILYIGGVLVLSWRELSSSLGAIGKKCTTVVGRNAFGLDRKGFWQFDGVSEKWLADPAVWDYFKARIDFSLPDEIICYYNRTRSTVEWTWPLVGGGREGWGYCLSSGQWCPRDSGLTAAMNEGTFGLPVGASGTELRYLDSGVDAGEEPLVSFIQTKPLALGTTQLWKFVDEIRLRMSGTALLTLGMQEDPDEAISWFTPEELSGRHFPELDVVFLTLKFSSQNLGDYWSVAGWEVFGKMGGARS
jgi:hypothetical protein